MREFRIETGGHSLEAAWWGAGPAEAPTLVMLHEGLGSVSLWRDVPARLAERTGYGVLAWSRAGYGRSTPVRPPRPLSYMHDEAAGGVGPVLDAAGVRKAVLVGHSDGASIATIYAGSVHDPRVRALVAIAPHYFVEDIGIAGIEAAKRAFQTGDLRTRLARWHDDVDATFWGWNGAWLDPAFRAWRIDEFIPYIRLPMLLVQGDADEYGTLAQIDCARSLAYGPAETIIVPGARHAPHLTHGDLVMDGVASFAANLFDLHEPFHAS